MAADLTVFINSVQLLLNDIERHDNTQNPNVTDSIISRLHCATDTARQLMERTTNYQYTTLSLLYQHLFAFLERWQNHACWTTNHPCTVSNIANNRTDGKVGRPTIRIQSVHH